MAGNRRAVEALNAEELRRGIAGDLRASWHGDYRDTSWVFVGGLDKSLSEGDVLCVLSQVGEVEDLHLVRDEDTGESRGFAFLKYEDWRSTVLAVDNFNGVELLGRHIHVDHTRYERPKKKKDEEAKLSLEERAQLQRPGHAYQDKDLAGDHSLEHGVNPFAAPDPGPDASLGRDPAQHRRSEVAKKSHRKKHKKERRERDTDEKKEKKEKKKKKKKTTKRSKDYVDDDDDDDDGASADRARSKHSKRSKQKSHSSKRRKRARDDDDEKSKAGRREHQGKKRRGEKSRREDDARNMSSARRDEPLDNVQRDASSAVAKLTSEPPADKSGMPEETPLEKRKRLAALANLPPAGWMG